MGQSAVALLQVDLADTGAARWPRRRAGSSRLERHKKNDSWLCPLCTVVLAFSRWGNGTAAGQELVTEPGGILGVCRGCLMEAVDCVRGLVSGVWLIQI